MIDSSVASLRGMSATIRRRASTRTRWLMPRISGNSDEIIRIADPLLGHPRDQGVDLRLSADVDAARQLVQDQNLRFCRQRASEDNLLLIAAGRSRPTACSIEAS